MTFVTAALVNSPWKLKTFITAVAFFAGFVGAYYGIFGLMAGSKQIVGTSKIGDNNTYAVWLCCLLPFIVYAARHLKYTLLRAFAYIIFFGNIIAVILTFSRGGFLTLIVVIILLTLNTKVKWLLVLLLPVIIAPILFFGPYDYLGIETQRPVASLKSPGEMSVAEKTLLAWHNRIKTLEQPKEEIASARSRMHFWKVAVKMANDKPIFGIGFNRYRDMYDSYDETGGKFGLRRAPHNVSLALLSGTGYVGFLIFISMVVASIVSITNATARVKVYAEKNVIKEFADYANMLRISLVAFFLGGFFVNVVFQDIFWVIIAIAVSMDFISVKLKQEKIHEAH
jgi:hypothetical protein